MNFILTYNMYMCVPVLSLLFYCVPCYRYRSWSFFWLMHWTISVTPFLHVVECMQSNHCRATAVAARQLGLDCYLFLRSSEQVSYTVCFLAMYKNEDLFTSVTFTWCPCCLNPSTLAHIYIAMGTRKTFLEQGMRTNNKFNAMYAFTSTVLKPGIHSLCWKVHAVCTLPSAIPPPLFCHRIRYQLFY